MCCILCLEESSMNLTFIDIFSDDGLRLNICNIISKHFTFQPKQNSTVCQLICKSCWEILKDFHDLYEKVLKAHKNLKDNIIIDNNYSKNLTNEYIPNDDNKHQNINNVFDTEVKVEVNDLDLLPPLQIIEDIANLNDTFKSTVEEEIKNVYNEMYLQNSMEPKCDIFAEINTSFNDLNGELENLLINSSEDTAIKTKGKDCSIIRKRGRPRKNNISVIVDQKELHSSTNTLESIILDENIELKINNVNVIDPSSENVSIDHNEMKRIYTKSINSSDSINLHNDLDCLTASLNSNINRYNYKSEENSAETKQYGKYSVIYKKIPKPKKYRKHPIPLIPPKRMSRSEIEKRNAQRVEYDHIISKFYKSMYCPKCHLLISSFGDMRAHFRISHQGDHGYVECCGRRFITRKSLAEHVNVHWNPENYQCRTCNKICLDSKQLENHENTHMPHRLPSKYKKLFQCDKCPKTFSSKVSFEHHSYTKHVPIEEFQFECQECQKKLPTKRKLKEHLKYTHNPQSSMICDKCGKTLKSGYSLKKHNSIEHTDKPITPPEPQQCEICGTWLRHLAGLKQHMKSMHEDTLTEHRCHICNKVSSTARALKRHVYHNHECAKKFKCTMCEKAFKRAQDLREHTSVHTGEVLYTCPNCPMTFFSNANMYKHRQRLHRAEWEADRKKPIPPNIMGQAKQYSKLVRLKRSSSSTDLNDMKKLL